MNQFEHSLYELSDYIQKEEFKGYDPYDILNSEFKLTKLNKNILFVLTQVHKRLPIDIRPLLKIRKKYSPKGIGILLHAYCKIYNYTGDEQFLSIAHKLYNLLLELKSEGYSGYCWGLNFAYAQRGNLFEAYTPCITVTQIIHEGLFEYYKTTEKSEVRDILRSSCDFVLKDLPKTETEDTICFSYFPFDRDRCFNANAMGAEMLARVYTLTGEDKLMDYAERSMRFTVSHQKKDGRWNYRKWEDGSEKEQVDFHQGNIVHSLQNYLQYISEAPPEFNEAMIKGAEFYYKNQFKADGQAFYRLPKRYPADIRAQAQGIKVLAELKNVSEKYVEFAKQVAEWTLENMKSEEGYFIYRKGRFVNYNQPFMRWGQSWMLLAFVTLIDAMDS